MLRNPARQKGTVIVETALMLPLFLLALMGALEFGAMFHNHMKLQNAAREGARYGAVGVTEALVRQRIQSFATNLDLSLLSITVVNAEGPRGEPISVEDTYSHHVITPLIGAIVGTQTMSLATQVTMRLE